MSWTRLDDGATMCAARGGPRAAHCRAAPAGLKRPRTEDPIIAEPTAITPWPAPAGEPALLFGGTFDPPHLAHVRLAIAAQRALGPETWLVAVPAARSPHKESGPSVGAGHRLAMVRLAFAGYPRAAVWTDELDRADGNGEPSYWAETAERASNACGGGELRTLIGADQAVKLHAWTGPERIMRSAPPVILPREPVLSTDDLRAALEAAGVWSAAQLDALCASMLDLDPMLASSTQVRGGRLGLMPAAVADYADRHGLYR